MVDDQIKEMLANTLFKSPDFETVWTECKMLYENLGFRNYNDEDMIEEFTYVAQQLRKYVFTKQSDILSHDTYEDMLAEVDNLIGKATEYGSNRQNVAYNFLRDHWLYTIRNMFMNIVDANDEVPYKEDYDA